MTRRAAIIVLDGLGIGPARDTAAYGDAGSDTLGNVARQAGGLGLPQLAALGLGHCAPIAGVAGRALAHCRAWELRAGERGQGQHHGSLGDLRPRLGAAVSNVSRADFRRTSSASSRGARAGACWATRPPPAPRCSTGTARSTAARGKWIVYTSADSVFQIAAHEATVPLAELYAAVRRPAGCFRASTASPGSSPGRSRANPGPGSARLAGRTSASRRRARRCWTGWRSGTSRGWAWERWTTSSRGGGSAASTPPPTPRPTR